MFVRTESFKEFLKLYPVTSIIIAIQILLFLSMNFSIFPQNMIFKLMAGVNILIIDGEYWRLITPILLHVGFSHLLFNSFSLVLFGPAMEKALGKILFIVVYFLSGVGANIATLLIQPPYYTHIGASGAIFGLFGVYLAIILTDKHSMPSHGKQVILPIALLSVIMTFFQPNVNITGHIFGLVTGFLIGKILFRYRTIRFR